LANAVALKSALVDVLLAPGAGESDAAQAAGLVELVDDTVGVVEAGADWAAWRFPSDRDTVAQVAVEGGSGRAGHGDWGVDVGADEVRGLVGGVGEELDLWRAHHFFGTWVLLAVGSYNNRGYGLAKWSITDLCVCGWYLPTMARTRIRLLNMTDGSC